MATQYPRFLQKAFAEQYNNDGLLVCARGLGMDAIIAKFIQLSCTGSDLVFILNATTMANVLVGTIQSSGVSIDDVPVNIANETAAQERKRLYDKGGPVFITSRILLVDLLRHRLAPDKISGLLIYDADEVTDTSQTAFIIRLFRKGNPTGFVRAFSEHPERLRAGLFDVNWQMHFW